MKKDNRIGETKLMNNGMKATIVDYKRANNIKIEFEDKTIVENKSYRNFINGSIANPNLKKKNKKEKTIEDIRNILKKKYTNEKEWSRIGEVKKMNIGGYGIITKYSSFKDMSVWFNNKTYTHQHYADFKNGEIITSKERKEKSKTMIGTTNKMLNGKWASIIKYRNIDDIDVQFENGEILEHVRYIKFEQGALAKKEGRLPKEEWKKIKKRIKKEKERKGIKNVNNSK